MCTHQYFILFHDVSEHKNITKDSTFNAIPGCLSNIIVLSNFIARPCHESYIMFIKFNYI